MLRLSRGLFLRLTGSALVAPSFLLANDSEVQTLLDHLLLGCKDLETGIDFVEQHTGIRAAFGGVHPGRGTENALLSLGEKHYLEIIAPDPGQADSKNPMALLVGKHAEPRLVGWAAHPGKLSSFARKLHDAGIAFEGPTPGSRKRPDGRLLQWQTLALKEDASGLLPFFIEWSRDSAHPSTDAPKGLRLLRFELVTPQPEALAKTAALLALEVPIVKGKEPQLEATVVGPKGELALNSSSSSRVRA
jgi:hypothetical protein